MRSKAAVARQFAVAQPFAILSRVGLGLAVLLASATPLLSARQIERHTLRGADVAVSNLAGRITVLGGSGSEVTIEALRQGRDAGRLRVETQETGGRVLFRVVYPSGDIVYPPMGRSSRTTVNVREDGTFGPGGSGLFSRGTTIRGSGSGSEAYADLTVTVPPGRKVEVNLGAGEISVANVDGDLRLATQSGSASSERTRGALHITTGSGSIRVSDMEGGAFEAQTGSGSITLDGVTSADARVVTGSGNMRLNRVQGNAISARTGSGSISGGEIGATSLSVNTGSGGIDLGRVGASELRADTGSGSVRIGLHTAPQSARITTGSGGVTITVPSTMGAMLDIETGSGSIHVGLASIQMTSRRNSFQGRIGDGGGTMRVRTGSGSVRINAN
jgi:lia operon protein LiaG